MADYIAPSVRPRMGLKAVADDSAGARAVIAAVSTVVEEAAFVADASGIKFRGTDPAHVAMVDIFWEAASFSKYECPEKVEFGIRIDEFSRVLRRGLADERISIGVGGGAMSLLLGTDRRYRLRLVDPSFADKEMPRVRETASILMPQRTFERVLGDVAVLSDYMSIRAGKRSFTFSGSGDGGTASISVAASDDVGITGTGQPTGTYSVEYMLPVIRAVGTAAQTVRCGFADKKPLHIEFRTEGVGVINYYLAPRVES